MLLGVVLRLLDVFARQLPGEHRIETLDALGGVAIGDRLDFEWMQFAEVGDLVERQRGVLDQPNGRCLRHQQRMGHGNLPRQNLPGRPPAGEASCHRG